MLHANHQVSKQWTIATIATAVTHHQLASNEPVQQPLFLKQHCYSYDTSFRSNLGSAVVITFKWDEIGWQELLHAFVVMQ